MDLYSQAGRYSRPFFFSLAILGAFMNADSDTIDERTAEAMLEQYLAADFYSDLTLPKKIPDPLVDRYLRTRVDWQRSNATFLQAAKLVVFYGLEQTLDHFAKFLNKQEVSDEDFLKSVAIVRMLALAGDAQHQKLATDYTHQHLLEHPLAHDHLVQLLPALTDLGPAASFERFEALCAAKLKTLQREKENSDGNYVRQQRFQRFVLNDVPRAHKALDVREKLEAKPPADRLPELMRIYLTLAPVPRGFLERWVVAEILRFAERDQAASRRVIETAREVRDAAEDLDPQTEQFIRLRIASLIEYLEADELDDSEQAFLEEHRDLGQDDPISLRQPVL